MSDQNRDSPHRPHRDYDDDFPPLNHLEAGTLPSIRSLLGPQRPRRGPSRESRPVRRGSRRPADVRRNPAISAYDRARPSDQAWEEGNAHLHLRNLLARAHDPSPGRSLTPGMASTSQTHRPHDLQEDSRRAKRRKVDADRLVPDFGGFRYGTYGQVKPGALRMEIVSCDGGMFLNEESYAAENILKNDGSVYCTKGNRCNIVLRHQGATVFNLTELVVKAPSSNYSSPVREGLVFVTMSHDDQLLRTAQYQIPYSSKPAGRTTAGQTSAGSEDRVGERGLRRSPPPIMTLRRRDGTVEVRRRNSLFSLGLDEDDLLDEDDDEDDEEEDEDDDEDEDEEQDYRLAQVPREFSTSSLLPFNVTMECSDDEGLHPSLRLGGRNAPDRIGSLPFESDDSDDDRYRDADDPFFDGGLNGFGLPDMSASLDESDAEPGAAQEPGRGSSCGGGDLMAPHARFNIEKGRSKCTIQFDPPISGRFILLKMWSPRQHAGSNIDIQTVVAKGFSGPRYFPAVKLA